MVVKGVASPTWVILWGPKHLKYGRIVLPQPNLDRKIVRGWDQGLKLYSSGWNHVANATVAPILCRILCRILWEPTEQRCFSTKWLWLKVATMWCHSPSRTFLSGPWAHVVRVARVKGRFKGTILFWFSCRFLTWSTWCLGFKGWDLTAFRPTNPDIKDLSDMIHMISTSMPRRCRGWARTCIHLGLYWKVLGVSLGWESFNHRNWILCLSVVASFFPISHLIKVSL